jgi:hypothetical protein
VREPGVPENSNGGAVTPPYAKERGERTPQRPPPHRSYALHRPLVWEQLPPPFLLWFEVWLCLMPCDELFVFDAVASA